VAKKDGLKRPTKRQTPPERNRKAPDQSAQTELLKDEGTPVQAESSKRPKRKKQAQEAAVPEVILPATAPKEAVTAAAETEQEDSGPAPEVAPPATAPRARASHSNALGILIERQFAEPAAPCRSYSDLERRSGISREALSRYVTARTDRRRSPTIDTLVAIADAMHLSLDAICRAGAAAVKGVMLPPESTQRAREESLSSLVAVLTDEQFSAVVELLRQMRPASAGSEG
jgi:transcriptional regulator with XRE-family HTH domain